MPCSRANPNRRYNEVVCCDPCAPFSDLPSGTFDGAICTGVHEQCPERDISWIVEKIVRRYPGVVWQVWIHSRVDGAQGPQFVERNR